MVPFEIDDSPPVPEVPMASLATQFQTSPGVDDYSLLMHVLHADGSIVEHGRTSTGEWVPVSVVKQAD